jgi:thiamine-monophosphate kinase
LHLLRELRSAGWVSAGIDVSDGLLADAAHLATASEVCLAIDELRVPLDPGLGDLPRERQLELGLTGGEDYEVLFTAPVEARGELEARGRGEAPGAGAPSGGVRLTRIGSVERGTGVVRVGPQGERTVVTAGGFDHFDGTSW